MAFSVPEATPKSYSGKIVYSIIAILWVLLTAFLIIGDEYFVNDSWLWFGYLFVGGALFVAQVCCLIIWSVQSYRVLRARSLLSWPVVYALFIVFFVLFMVWFLDECNDLGCVVVLLGLLVAYLVVYLLSLAAIWFEEKHPLISKILTWFLLLALFSSIICVSLAFLFL